jgi:hypothetical protein
VVVSVCVEGSPLSSPLILSDVSLSLCSMMRASGDIIMGKGQTYSMVLIHSSAVDRWCKVIKRFLNAAYPEPM